MEKEVKDSGYPEFTFIYTDYVLFTRIALSRQPVAAGHSARITSVPHSSHAWKTDTCATCSV